jgi:hypothetical protein
MDMMSGGNVRFLGGFPKEVAAREDVIESMDKVAGGEATLSRW